MFLVTRCSRGGHNLTWSGWCRWNRGTPWGFTLAFISRNASYNISHRLHFCGDVFFEIMCSVYASVLEVGTTSHGLDGVVGTVGHRRGSPSHSFVEMHRITYHNVNIFVGGFLKLCAPCTRVFSKWAQPHMVWMVSLEPWDTVGVHPRIHFWKRAV